jgi:hypothetical protein
MSDNNGNLTGVWDGLYIYSAIPQAVGFCATLIESPGWLTGATHEICTSGSERSMLILATLEGHRDGAQVNFVKYYEGSPADFFMPVHYEGIVSDSGVEIEGDWSIGPDWTGRFLMVRSGGTSIEDKREAFEKAK